MEKLMINTETGVWSLFDAAGRVLISDGTFSSTGKAIQITHTAAGLLYGAGNNSSKKLEKDQSGSSASNGVADIPYFWNSRGYSAFGVSSNDDIPATWNRVVDKATLTWKFSEEQQIYTCGLQKQCTMLHVDTCSLQENPSCRRGGHLVTCKANGAGTIALM